MLVRGGAQCIRCSATPYADGTLRAASGGAGHGREALATGADGLIDANLVRVLLREGHRVRPAVMPSTQKFL
jgi:hypothetical protein